MSRKLLIPAALLLALVIAAPWWVGGQVRSALPNNMLYLMPENIQRQINITELDYERGWFRSRANYQFDLLAGNGETASLLVAMDIRHGPWVTGPGGSFPGLASIRVQPSLRDPAFQEALEDLADDLPEMNMDLRVGLNQRLDVALTMAPMEISEADEELSFAGLEAYLLTNADLSAEGFVSIGQITASGSDMGFTMEGMEIETGTEQINDLFAPSFAMLAVPAVKSNQSLGFSASVIQASTRLSVTPGTDDQLDLAQQISIGDIQSNMPLESLDWQLAIREVPVDLLRNYSELATALQEQLARNGGNFDAQVNALLQQGGVELLRNSLAMTNHTELRAYDGDHLFHLELDYGGMPGLTDLASLDIRNLIAALTITVELDLDLEAVLRSPAAGMIDTYVQQGYIVVDSGRVRLQGSLADSTLQLNGESIAIEPFL